MVSLSGFLNKAFGGSADSVPVQTTPQILTRVTGSYSNAGNLSITTMEADDAIHWYERVSMIFRCVDLIATTQSDVPLVQRNGNGEGEIVDDPHLYRLLNVKPNDYETAFQFRYRISSLLLLDPKGVLLEIQRSTAGIPVALHIVVPGTWAPVREERDQYGLYKNFVDFYEVRNGAGPSRIETENAIWLKGKPHPSDPYRQVTPLTSARLSAETDFFARLFNRNFLVNDGRPGLLVAVKGNITEEDSEELKRRFSGGHTRAGQTTVIESEGLEIKDLASSPRDIQWDAAVRGSDQDIMLAFGTPESVIGNAAGRTFNNADAEWANFWELTMKSHCRAISAGLDSLTASEDDDIVLIHNYDTVPVLQLPKKEKEAESLSRWKEGVITLNEHLETIGLEPVEEDYANVRFLHNNVIAGPPEIAERVGKLPVVGVPSMAAQMELQQAQMSAMGGGFEAEALPDDETSMTQLTTGYEEEEYPEEEVFQGELVDEEKVLRQIGERAKKLTEAIPPTVPSYARERMEGVLEGILDYWHSRMVEIIIQRLDHAKFREGTRFWVGNEEKANPKPIDPRYAVEVDKWSTDLSDAVMKQVEKSIDARLRDDISYLRRRLRRNPDPAMLEFLNGIDRDRIKESLLNDLRVKTGMSATNRAEKLLEVLQRSEEEGRPLEEIKGAIRDYAQSHKGWIKTLSTNLTTSAMEGARKKTFGESGKYSKVWKTRGDDKVRHSHAAVDGRMVPAGRPFMVDGFPMMHPGDMNAPPALTENCRCWTRYVLG